VHLTGAMTASCLNPPIDSAPPTPRAAGISALTTGVVRRRDDQMRRDPGPRRPGSLSRCASIMPAFGQLTGSAAATAANGPWAPHDLAVQRPRRWRRRRWDRSMSVIR
jgi:hypothetical protein